MRYCNPGKSNPRNRDFSTYTIHKFHCVSSDAQLGIILEYIDIDYRWHPSYVISTKCSTRTQARTVQVMLGLTPTPRSIWAHNLLWLNNTETPIDTY